MAELGNFFVTVGSKFDKAGFDKARAAINKVALAGIAMGGALAFASIKAANAAGVQEQAEFLLANALKTSKNAAGVSIDQLKKYASHLQSVTTVGDETSLKTMQLGLSMGISADEIEGATKQAIGLSKAYQVDLNASMKLVALARAGEFSMMARYIPQLRGMTDKTKMAAIANEAMANGFKIAEAETDTYLGMVAQLKNILGDLWEDVGFKIIPTFKEYIKIIKEEIVPKVKKWINDSGNLETVIKKVVAVIRFVTKTTYAFAKTIDFTIQSVGVASDKFMSWGARILQVGAWLARDTVLAKEFGKQAKEHADKAKKGMDKLANSVIKAGMTIDEMNALELESFRLKEEGKTQILTEQTELQNELAEEDAAIDMTMQEAITEFHKIQLDKKDKAEKKLHDKRLARSKQFGIVVSDALGIIQRAEVVTWATVADAYKQSVARMIGYIIQRFTADFIAKKAMAVMEATITWGAAAWQIPAIIAAGTAAMAGLNALKNFDKGGIVGGRLGQPQLAIVHGGETVIPSGGGFGNITINVNQVHSRREAEAQARIIGDVFLRKVKKTRRI